MSHELHDLLLQVKREGPSICDQLRLMVAEQDALKIQMQMLFARWPENKAQDLALPVECDLEQFKKAGYANKLWENPRRHALLDWLIEETKP